MRKRTFDPILILVSIIVSFPGLIIVSSFPISNRYEICGSNLAFRIASDLPLTPRIMSMYKIPQYYSPMASHIGFIGLGIMGNEMAGRLLSEGIAGSSSSNALVVWNRSKEKCSSLQERFKDKVIIICDSPKEVVERSTITFSMLSTPEASREVFYGETGVLAGVSEGKAIVDCATLAEKDMKEMSDCVVSKGCRFLEAPVSGSKGPAASGQLIFLCAGSKTLFDEVVHSALKAMGKASHFFSESVGVGTRAKLVINALMTTMMGAFAESLVLSQNVGLDPLKIIEVIGQGAIQSPMYALKGPKMLQSDHAPNFPLKHAHKDIKLACDMAEASGSSYRITAAAESLYQLSMTDTDLNVADEDFSAIFEKINRDSMHDD